MPLILGAQSAVATGFAVDNSCRFNTPDSPNLTRACGTPTDNLKYTISFWFKRSLLSTDMYIMSAKTDGNNYFQLRLKSDNFMYIWDVHGGGSPTYKLTTNRIFRDVGAWYHVVYVYDSANASAGDRMRLYINGTEETSFASDDNPAQDYASNMNLSGTDIDFGDMGAADYYGGYIAEAVLIDGQALTPSDFGEFDSDSPTIWKPIDVSGLTFGNNGFHLDFKDSANLGNDANGGTDFTETNIVAADQGTDTPTNNFCTLNSLDNFYASSTFSEGNCKITTDSSAYAYNTGTVGLSAGLWYWEMKDVAAAGSGDEVTGIAAAPTTSTTDWVGKTSETFAYYGNTGQSYTNDVASSYGDTWADSDIIGVYLDLTANKLYFAKNGTVQNSGTGISITAAASTATGLYFPAASDYHSAGSGIYAFNFGGCSAFDVTSANQDANGYGNFEYSPSDGGSASFDGSAKDFLAICTKNLATDGG